MIGKSRFSEGSSPWLKYKALVTADSMDVRLSGECPLCVPHEKRLLKVKLFWGIWKPRGVRTKALSIDVHCLPLCVFPGEMVEISGLGRLRSRLSCLNVSVRSCCLFDWCAERPVTEEGMLGERMAQLTTVLLSCM